MTTPPGPVRLRGLSRLHIGYYLRCRPVMMSLWYNPVVG
ncbi:MAG: hypothetical protein KatS3mg055_0690 [Chloroflexus sp.]|nr:MAG: hypothetical protein KatS3mg055_0690 [Chloroflexus sp.]